MQLNQITPYQLARNCRLVWHETEYQELAPADQIEVEGILQAAVDYVAGYTGLSPQEEVPDSMVYAVLTIGAEMFDNRQMTQQYSTQNPTVKQILAMYSTNLLPSVEEET